MFLYNYNQNVMFHHNVDREAKEQITKYSL